MPDQKKTIYLQDTSSTNSKINNEESRKIVDELKPEDKMSIGRKSKQDERTDNKEYGKIDDTEPKPEGKVTFDKTSNQEGRTNNKETDEIVDTEQKLEDKVTPDKTSNQEGRTDNKEADEIVDTEQKLEDKVTPDKTTKQEDNKESGRIEGELKPEHKICIDNKSRMDDGPPPAIKINNVNNEFGESSAAHSIENQIWTDNEESGGRNNEMLYGDETCINNTADLEDGLLPTTSDEKHSGEMGSCNSRTLEKTVNSRKRCQNQDESLYDNEQYNILKKIKVEDNSDDQFIEMWEYLHYDLSNFSLWVDLLQLVDVQNIEDNARKAYPKFLELYPLCYGYWKKFANFEKRNNNIQEFETVLRNGLCAIPLSVDLWIYYMKYLIDESSNEDHYIRSEFERCLKICGLHYCSDQLWQDYITWEINRNEVFNAANIYYRFLRTPTANCSKNFYKFQEFIFKTLPEECLGLAEYIRRRNVIIQSFGTNHNKKLMSYDTIPPGEDFQQEIDITEESIIYTLRVDIIDELNNIHQQTVAEFERRKIFEENIRRPHFHVNELESAQIINWENYLQFEKRAGNHERIILLYERCLIACASYERFWVTYLDYLSSFNVDDIDLLSDVLNRSLFYHPKSLQLNLKYFDFSETQGCEEIAIASITQLGADYPDSIEVIGRIINLARKEQDDTIRTLYKHYLNCSQSKSFSSFIAVKYARFVWKHDRQLDLALDILHDTITKKKISVNDSLEIYLTQVELKIELNPKDHLSILKMIDDIILQCNSYKKKLMFSKKKIEYAEDYIQDYNMLRLAKIENKNFRNAFFLKKKQLLNNTM